MMANIKARDTKPEIAIRKALHSKGYRYKLHDNSLPGKPDMVFPQYNAVIQIQGCFWHMHDCHLFKWPKTRPDFWRDKITGNKMRDKENLIALQQLGWRVLEIWECAIKGKFKRNIEEIICCSITWLHSESIYDSISGIEKHKE